MDKFKPILVTACGVLGAILLVWAQLWYKTAEQYANSSSNMVTAKFGLTYDL
jgi:ABC-type Fe3+-siderophore transport system permease subunit